MAEYKVVDGNELDAAAFLVARLERSKDGRTSLAKWAQVLLTELVDHGYAVPTVEWAVRDTKYLQLMGARYATKDEALAARRGLGGNSARYRVEALRIPEPSTETESTDVVDDLFSAVDQSPTGGTK